MPLLCMRLKGGQSKEVWFHHLQMRVQGDEGAGCNRLRQFHGSSSKASGLSTGICRGQSSSRHTRVFSVPWCMPSASSQRPPCPLCPQTLPLYCSNDAQSVSWIFTCWWAAQCIHICSVVLCACHMLVKDAAMHANPLPAVGSVESV